MNVYVRELCGALARAGVECDVYTRTWQEDLPPVVAVEPGFRVHHVDAGPRAPVAVDDLVEVVDEFTAGVRVQLEGAFRPDLIHANYWLSGLSGHVLKHQLELPLVSTFHTLARVKAEAAADHHGLRARAEAEIIGCSDAILALSHDEAAQLERLYHAVPERVEIVPPGVDHRLFSPGDKAAARAALGLDPVAGDAPVLLFVGRIQPLKGADVAVRTLAQLPHEDATLVVVGGPSGPDGESELRRLHQLVDDLGLHPRVRFVEPRPHEELTTFYRAADVCLVPSRSESFGLVALEAAACGTPVVAAAVGGLATLVIPGITGFLVEGRDPASYAAYAAKLLDDPDLAALVGAQAAALARRYRWSITAGRLRRLYSDLTARRLVECS
ncbi:MAG: D-inositol-3-phosphate glycosyltransferase [Actinomycetota bacterium]|nr:D-inositol-3-phosphate glycosyltransferase [Actinomycetota bacterium]